MKFGLARVSTDKQDTTMQIDALTKYGVDEIVEEKVTGTGTRKKRPVLDELLKRLRTGDTFVVYNLRRLGRRAVPLMMLLEEFQEKGIEFVSLTENIDTTTPMGKAVAGILCIFAQMDRDIIVSNVRAGLDAARARGRVGGRPPLKKAKVELAMKMYFSKEYSIREIMEASGIGRSAIFEYAKVYKKEYAPDEG